MRVGTILLTKDNCYINDFGDLPTRPKHDKYLLSEVCKGQVVSEEAYSLLPLSVQKICMVGAIPTVPITIKELSQCDILIVSRSAEDCLLGKTFRLDNFNLVVKDRKIEIWSKK